MAPPSAGGGGTIGERLGALKGLLTSRVAEAQQETSTAEGESSAEEPPSAEPETAPTAEAPAEADDIAVEPEPPKKPEESGA